MKISTVIVLIFNMLIALSTISCEDVKESYVKKYTSIKINEQKQPKVGIFLNGGYTKNRGRPIDMGPYSFY